MQNFYFIFSAWLRSGFFFGYIENVNELRGMNEKEIEELLSEYYNQWMQESQS